VINISTGVKHCSEEELAEAYLHENLPAGQYVYLEITDTGCGMMEETKSEIVDPFYTTKFTGRGLGLAAVLGIVRGHRGAIKVYSELGKGTTFVVLFPASHLKARSIIPYQANNREWKAEGTVLVVDDEDAVRKLACSMLERMGFSILTASDGREGVELFRQHSERITLVLLDMTMPIMGGEETFHEMRRIRSDMKIILTSGYNEQTATNHFTGLGLAGFIQKPFTFEALTNIVRRVLVSDTYS